MRTRLMLISALLIGATLAMAMALGGGQGGEPEYTTDFRLARCQQLLPNGGNPYFSLHPGTFLRLEGEEDDEFVELEITVLGETRSVSFEVDGQWITATTRVVEEREWIDGELVEVSLNYFARCLGSGDIFYFGEDVDIYEDGGISHEGAWLAGEEEAQPGLIMPGLFLLGSRYFQEIAPEVAMDRAEHVEMGLEIETPAGVFEDCVMVLETTPLDHKEESIKIYAPGIGLIVDDFLELVDYHQ